MGNFFEVADWVFWFLPVGLNQPGLCRHNIVDVAGGDGGAVIPTYQIRG
jgi:hypothetical protein